MSILSISSDNKKRFSPLLLRPCRRQGGGAIALPSVSVHVPVPVPGYLFTCWYLCYVLCYLCHTLYFMKLSLGKLNSGMVGSLDWSLSQIWSQWSFHCQQVSEKSIGLILLKLTNMLYIPMAKKSLGFGHVATTFLATMAISNLSQMHLTLYITLVNIHGHMLLSVPCRHVL